MNIRNLTIIYFVIVCNIALNGMVNETSLTFRDSGIQSFDKITFNAYGHLLAAEERSIAIIRISEDGSEYRLQQCHEICNKSIENIESGSANFLGIIQEMTNAVEILDAHTMQQKMNLPTPQSLRAISFSPNANLIAVGCGGDINSIHVCDTRSREEIFRTSLYNYDTPTAVSFLDDATFYVSTLNGHLLKQSVSGPCEKHCIHGPWYRCDNEENPPLNGVACHLNSAHIAVQEGADAIRIYKSPSFELLTRIPMDRLGLCSLFSKITFKPNGQLALGFQHGILLYTLMNKAS